MNKRCPPFLPFAHNVLHCLRCSLEANKTRRHNSTVLLSTIVFSLIILDILFIYLHFSWYLLLFWVPFCGLLCWQIYSLFPEPSIKHNDEISQYCRNLCLEDTKTTQNGTQNNRRYQEKCK